MPTHPPAVEVLGVTHRYADRTALSDLTFAVEAGRLFGLLGPNGSGKSTLFRILSTLLTPTRGTARVDGLDVVTQRDAVRANLGIVFQRPALDVKLTVSENLMHHGHLYGLGGPPLRQRSVELLGRFGVSDRGAERVENLSGGLQRRVELCKALLPRPSVLILDEPGAGLDPAARINFLTALRELSSADGVTCLLTTHLLDEADRCDVLGVLDEGRLAAVGSPAELKSAIGGDVISVACGNPSALAKEAQSRFGVTAALSDGMVRIERARGHEFVPQLVEAFPGEIESISVGKPTLDDVFLRLTGHHLWSAAAEARGNEN